MSIPSLSSMTDRDAIRPDPDCTQDLRKDDAEPLLICQHLFLALAEAKVRYCHWKSNEHLLPGLTGDTDLDVLVDRNSSHHVQRVLAELDFKSFQATSFTRYPGIEDYLGFDADTGKLVHLHLHHQLVLGQQGLKGYRLPLEEELLNQRIQDPHTAVSVCEPHWELLLLLLRLAFKLRGRDPLRRLLGRPCAGRGSQREFEWLQARTTPEATVALAVKHFGKQVAAPVRELLEGGLAFQGLYRLRSAARPTFARCTTYQPQAASLRILARRLTRRCLVWKNRFQSTPEPLRRTSPRGGTLIAIVGADGAGKSTIVKELQRWTSWKLDATRVYFGSGDGPVSISRKCLSVFVKAGSMARQLVIRSGEKQTPKTVASPAPRDVPALSNRRWFHVWLSTIRVLLIARERRRNLVVARQARNRGMVVLADRYPQTQFLDMMDSPHLSEWKRHPNKVLRALTAWETKAYESAATPPPDLVIKLCVDPQVAHRRKGDQTMPSLTRRCQIVRELTFPRATKTVAIDANLPLDHVLVETKRAIWNLL
ncbi:MAG: hypothetical protein VX346_01965 [Planctomycetota bacterium]|nr:hypothetical protein [Planctomycetota bacterium]